MAIVVGALPDGSASNVGDGPEDGVAGVLVRVSSVIVSDANYHDKNEDAQQHLF